MENTLCLLMTSNYHVNMIEFISILDKENKFKSTLWKTINNFCIFEREKRLPYNIDTQKHCAEFSDKHYTKQICMFKILLTTITIVILQYQSEIS